VAKNEQPTIQGEESYCRWRKQVRENPEYQAIYDEEAAKSELWLQLAEGPPSGRTASQSAMSSSACEAAAFSRNFML